MKLTGKNILVTGGTGFIGSHLVERLTEEGARIICSYQDLDQRSYFFTKNLDQKVILINLDVCDFNKLFNIVTKHQIDYIFHLAAQPIVETAFYNPKETLYTNIIGTINVLESVRLFSKIKGAIIASSDKAYGKLTAKKYQENHALKGTHPYEVSKSSADLISYAYYKTYNLPIAITRFGNIYGEGDLNFSRIIPGIMKSIINKEKLELRSNGRPIRDYLYVKDVVDGYILIAENISKFKGEAFNFGSKDTYSVLKLIQLVNQILDKNINYSILDTAHNEIDYQSLDYSKATKKLGWKPKNNLELTIQNIFEWYNILKI